MGYVNMSVKHEIENEWRVQPDADAWTAILNEAKAIANSGANAHVSPRERLSDLVFGRVGFDSVGRDGWIVRIREGGGCLLELKERLTAESWKETKAGVGSANSVRYILERLGLGPHLLLLRYRTTISDGLYTLCFDEIENLGFFIEVEFENGDGHSPLSKLVERINRLEKKPAYGDIVKEKVLGDPEFRRHYREQIRGFHFST